MTERNAAIHATRRLLLQLVGRQFLIYVKPIVDPLDDRTAGRAFASVFEKSCQLRHRSIELLLAPAAISSLRSRRAFPCARGTRDSEHALKLVREHFYEFRQHFRPVFKNPLASRAARVFDVFANQALKEPDI